MLRAAASSTQQVRQRLLSSSPARSLVQRREPPRRGFASPAAGMQRPRDASDGKRITNAAELSEKFQRDIWDARYQKLEYRVRRAYKTGQVRARC